MREKPLHTPILRSKLFWVAFLYFAEGFPLGIFYDIFPVYFRQQGVDLSKIGLLSLLGLAWTLKFLWAPVIEVVRRHRYWMAAADLAMGCVMLFFAAQAGFGLWVWVTIGLFTVFSATNDIATDGYTIEFLGQQEIGLANGIRIGFYRLGMLTAGVVLILSDFCGWPCADVAAAVVFALAAVVCLSVPRETVRQAVATGVSLRQELRAIVAQPSWALPILLFLCGLLWPITGAINAAWITPYKAAWWFKGGIPVGAMLLAGWLVTRTIRAAPAPHGAPRRPAGGPVFGALIELLSRPGIVPVLVFILIFKLADASMGFMVKPFWVDSGFTNKAIGLVSVNLGLVLSVLGGLVGGWYTDRVGIFKALWVLGLWQAFSNLGYALAASILPLALQGGMIALEHQALVYGASMIESFTGGLGTAAFLAFLMATVSKEQATTEYAILSSIFAFSRSVAGWAGGIGAQEMGYAAYFLLTFFLAFPAYALLGPVRRMLRVTIGDHPESAPS